MGWLGWSEEQTLNSDVNAIIVGYNGRIDMFEAAGFIQREAEPLGKMTPEIFDSLF